MHSSGASAISDFKQNLRRFAYYAALCWLTLLASGLDAQPLEREAWPVYRERRTRLAEIAADGPIALFGLSAAEGRPGPSSFRQENNFYYLTGCNEPDAALLIEPATGEHPYRETLYLPKRAADARIWDGEGLDPDAPDAALRTGFERVLPIDQLGADLAAAGDGRTIHTLSAAGLDDFLGGRETDAVEWIAKALPDAPTSDLRRDLVRMRVIKSTGEIGLIEKAVQATVAAHKASWERMRPGIFEYEIFAVMSRALIDGGCVRPAYPPIIGAGPNAAVLHYAALERRALDGEIVLLDVGGEYSGYAADLTRSVPVAGKFTKRQRRIYEWVLGAQQAVIDAVRPGMTLGGHGSTSLQGVAEAYFEDQKRGLSRRMPHGVSHHVGLDVHDPAPPGPLEAGMVITVEPGLYYPDDDLGIRIEDMVLVTEDGARVLSVDLPKDPDEIEALLAR